PVGIPVLLVQESHRLLYVRPVALQEIRVRGVEMLAVRLEDVPALGVACPEVPPFSPEADGAVRFEPDARCKVLHFPDRPLELGEEPRHGVGVVPDVSARAVATAVALPRPETAVSPPEARRA